MTDPINDNIAATDPGKARFREAYERALPDMAGLAESDLVTINLDIPTVATTALGAWPEIAAMRDAVRGLGTLDLEMFDKVETYAMAAMHAHGAYLAASTPAVPLPELGSKAAAAREMLLSDVLALAKRGLIDGERIKELRGPQGYRNVAVDVLVLVTLFRERWATVNGKTALTLAELDAAERLGEELITTIGQREQAPMVVAAATDNRQRAFTLLVRAYDQARRAITFLRWNKGDVEHIAPSLYAGRSGNARRRGTELETKEPALPTLAPSAEPMTTVTPTPVNLAAPVPPSASARVPAGFPGSDPFGK